MTLVLEDLDPFDLPEWLGEDEVTWSSASALRIGHLLPGELVGTGGARIACDLLAVDQAYPVPVVGESCRSRAHQTWQHGQVLVARVGDRPTLAVPGTCFTADQVLEALGRLARAVGAEPARYAARLRA